MKLKKLTIGILYSLPISILIWLILATLICLVIGCTRYHAKIGNAEVDMFYFLQDKQFESITFDPNVNTFIFKGLKSENAQVVSTAVKAALGGGK